ncbi:hypothetical protein XENTR_v10016181 [Xenopus tropicalis]|nr:hypothetical protein XENTR_v10016181 [Xenopus tropicalis]
MGPFLSYLNVSDSFVSVLQGLHHRRGVVAVKMANITWSEESVRRELKFLRQFGGHKNLAAFYGAYYRAPLKKNSSELLEVRNYLLVPPSCAKEISIRGDIIPGLTPFLSIADCS